MPEPRRDETRLPMLLVVAGSHDEGRAFVRDDARLRTLMAMQRVRIVTSERALRGWRTGTLVMTTGDLWEHEKRLFSAVGAFIASRHLKLATDADLDRVYREVLA